MSVLLKPDIVVVDVDVKGLLNWCNVLILFALVILDWRSGLGRSAVDKKGLADWGLTKVGQR